MGRDKQIITYVSEPEKRTISAKAEAADKSVSEWVHDAMTEKIEREGIESTGQRYRFEERLLDLVDEASERAAEKIADDLRDDLGDETDNTDEDMKYADWGE
jgi:hypothetical protein